MLATKGQKSVYDASGNCNKENLTILLTGNAAGEMAPPMALVSYKKIPSDIAATANPDWPIGRTENGWMTCQSFFEYVANILEPHLKDVPKPVILFLDNHSSHVSLQLSEFCEEKGIILVALPPNTTHILQPLDVSFFGPLKKYWNKELEIFKLTKNIEPRKCHVLPIMESLLNKPNFETNLISGFKACGLLYLNPDDVDYSKCLKDDDADSEKQEDQVETRTNGDERELLMKQFEQQLPISLKEKFDELGVEKEWCGNEKLIGLFNFYRSVKFNLTFENLMGDFTNTTGEILRRNSSHVDLMEGTANLEPLENGKIL